MKLPLLAIGAALVLAGAGCMGGGGDQATDERAMLTMPSGDKVRVEVAKSPSQVRAGLSGREDVGNGMLFCMDATKDHEFWMLGMKVPIDMVWVHGGDVRGASANVPLMEDGEVTRRTSIEPVNMVLELPAGDAERYGLVADTFLEGAVEACE